MRHKGIVGGPGVRFLDIIKALGLQGNLLLCLDAGDAASYTSGQSWLDLSGNGYDFFRGTTSGADATDPTFNGTAGGLSKNEYWSFDGGDYFEYDSVNEAWMDNMHKNNALFSWFMLAYNPTGGIGHFGGTKGGGAGSGFNWYPGQLNVYNAGADVLTITTGLPGIADEWEAFGFGLDEAGNTFVAANQKGTYSGACTYTAPSAAAAAFKLNLGSQGNGSDKFTNNRRMALVAAWSIALKQEQISALCHASLRRFGA